MPLIRPAIMLGTIWTFNQFNVIYFVSQGGPWGVPRSSSPRPKLVLNQRPYGVAAAFSIVVFFVLVIITLIQNRVTRATEAYEEAAVIDGASMTQIFICIIMPLSVPALAVTILFAFMSGWTEFILAWTFLENPAASSWPWPCALHRGSLRHRGPILRPCRS